MPRKRLIDPIFELSKKRIDIIRLKPEKMNSFNASNEKIITEKTNLIKQHITSLNKVKAKITNAEKNRIEELLKSIDNLSTKTKTPEKPNPQKINPEQKNRGLQVLFKEKKRIIELIKQEKVFGKLKKHARNITSIIQHYKTKLILLEKNRSDLTVHKYYLQDYTNKINSRKISENIEKLANNKKLSDLIKANKNIENLILNKASEIQSTFPTRNTKRPIVPTIIDEIKKELLVTNNQIITRINKLKELNKSDSEIISETLNFIRYTLKNNIQTRITKIDKEINKLKPVIDEYKQEISQKEFGSGNKRLEDIYIHIRKITNNYPELKDENLTTLKQKLDTTSKELELAMQKSKARIVINPREQVAPKNNLDVHIEQRNKAIILSKIEREIYKLIEKYGLKY